MKLLQFVFKMNSSVVTTSRLFTVFGLIGRDQILLDSNFYVNAP